MSKAIANKVLKTLGMGTIKYISPNMHETTPCIKGPNGKRMQGIYCSSRGPVTVTDAYINAKDAKCKEVSEHLSLEFSRERGDHGGFVVAETSKRQTVLDLNVEYLQTYQYKENRDRGYISLYIVPRYRIVEK